jgi:hypothetical protein
MIRSRRTVMRAAAGAGGGMDVAERAAQRLVDKIILMLVIEHERVSRADAIAAFAEARAQLARSPIDARSRAVLVAAVDHMLAWLEQPRVWH